jgi:hypothetical protein
MTTIYQFAQAEMGKTVVLLLDLASTTKNFTEPSAAEWDDEIKSEALLCGKGFNFSVVE